MINNRTITSVISLNRLQIE